MRRIVQISILALLATVITARAEPQIRVSIVSDTPQPYLHQLFNLTLVVEFAEMDLAQNYQIMGLPDGTVLELATTQELPAEQFDENGLTFQRRRFVWKARARQVGTIHLTPTLRVGVLTRHNSIIGFSTAYMARDVSVTPLQIPVRGLPTPDTSVAFSGAVGQFNLEVVPSATDIAVGDLIDLRITLRGEGYWTGITPPILTAADQIKAYPPKPVDSGDGPAFVQTVVPQSAVPEIGKLSFCYFDPVQEQYVTTEAGPFPLTYHERSTSQTTQYIPSATATVELPSARDRSVLDKALRGKEVSISLSTQARLAPAPSAKITFEASANSNVRIIRTVPGWVLIEHQDRRGWIPDTAIAAPPATH